MIEPILNSVAENLTTISLWAILGLSFLMVSRLRKSLTSELTSRINSAVALQKQSALDFELKVKSYSENLYERAFLRLDETLVAQKLEFNQWLEVSLEGLADKLVKQPLAEIMQSTLMSRLGKASGESRATKALENEVMNAALPEGATAIRDEIIKRFPSTKGLLKDPNKLMSIANMLGIDVNQIIGSQGSNGSNSGGSKQW